MLSHIYKIITIIIMATIIQSIKFNIFKLSYKEKNLFLY